MSVTRSLDKNPLYQGLVLDLPMNEGAGTVVRDHAKAHHIMTTAGSPTWTTQGNLPLLSFNGSTDKLTTPHASDLMITTGTLAAWVYINAVETGGIIDKGYTSGGYMLWLENPLTAGFNLYVNNTFQSQTAALSLSTWYCVVAVIDGVKNPIYLNGEAGTGSGSATPSGNSTALSVACEVLGRYPNVNIWRPRIWNRPLAPAEVRQILNMERHLFGV